MLIRVSGGVKIVINVDIDVGMHRGGKTNVRTTGFGLGLKTNKLEDISQDDFIDKGFPRTTISTMYSSCRKHVNYTLN